MTPPPMPGEEAPRRNLLRALLLVAAVFFAGAWIASLFFSVAEIEEGSVVLLPIGGSFEERPVDDLTGLLAGEGQQSLFDLLLLIRDAAENERVSGLVVHIRPLAVGWAKTREIRDSLLDFRKSGKRLVAYLEAEFSPSALEYYLATAAAEIFVPPAGSALIDGLVAEYLFLGGLWEKLDIEMQVVQLREYKTAGDMLANKEMSAEHREMADSLLDSVYGQLARGVAEQRGMDETRVREIIDRGLSTAEDLLAAELIDGVRYLDDIAEELGVRDRGFLEAAELVAARPERAVESAGRVALVFGVGPIVTGPSADGLLGEEPTIGSDTLSEILEETAEDEEIDAVVFRVDSPGGSALASDLIWRATQRVAENKPLIVSMSDVAGSGGYYVAAGASQILASAGTLTGSIGVVMAKPGLRGLLARAGIGLATVRRGEHAGIASSMIAMSEQQLARVRDDMEDVYDLFVSRVAAGRGMAAGDVEKVARGRVWTGEQALANGLVDQLGGLLASIDEAKKAIGVDPANKVEIVMYPRTRGLVDRLLDALAGRVTTRLPRWWKRMNEIAVAYDFADGSILTLMPQSVRIR